MLSSGKCKLFLANQLHQKLRVFLLFCLLESVNYGAKGLNRENDTSMGKRKPLSKHNKGCTVCWNPWYVAVKGFYWVVGLNLKDSLWDMPKRSRRTCQQLREKRSRMVQISVDRPWVLSACIASSHWQSYVMSQIMRRRYSWHSAWDHNHCLEGLSIERHEIIWVRVFKDWHGLK